VTQRSLEEAHTHEELQHAPQRSLEEAHVHEEIQCMMQRSLEEAHADKRSCDALNKEKSRNMCMRS
jgi:hypothetical protein